MNKSNNECDGKVVYREGIFFLGLGVGGKGFMNEMFRDLNDNCKCI